MHRKQLHSFPILFFLSVVLITGCKSGSKENATLIEDVGENNNSGIESFEQIYHLYPSPAEMLSIINMADMNYDGEILAPVRKSDQYIDTRSKTHMLGVYMTNLAYAALFGRHEATLDYLELVKSMAEDIRIDRAVDDRMIENARKNVEYLDSLYTISNEAFMNVLAFCERNERSNTVVMLSAGAFVESLYLAVNLIDDYEKADYLLQHLADQKYTIDNFMTFAESVGTKDQNVVETIEDLQKIKEIYDGIQPGSGSTTVTRAEDMGEGEPKRLVIGGGQDQKKPGLTREEFDALRSAVVELRTKLVEG